MSRLRGALVHAGFKLLANICLPSQSNRELEGCATSCCEKCITVAQLFLILETYLNSPPGSSHTVKDHRATKHVGC